jgi:tripartite-type tricarboxylate transporter receptor subunit TctC
MLRRTAFLIAGAVGVLALTAPLDAALAYPDKPVRLYIGYPPAGASGQIASIMAKALSPVLSQPVEIVPLVGNDGILAAAQVAKASADGYALLLTTTGMVTFHQFIHKDLPYNPQRDFAAVSLIADMDNVLMTRPDFPAQTLPALIERAKSGPSPSFARVDFASTNSLAMLLFSNLAQIEVSMATEWPTLSTAMDALAESKVDLSMQNLSAALPWIRAAKVRALATTGRTRSRALPGIPTIGETIPDYRADAWFGIVAPRATPRDIVRLLNGDISRVLVQPDTRARFEAIDAVPIGGSAEEFETFIQSERTKWRRVTAAAKIEPQ